MVQCGKTGNLNLMSSLATGSLAHLVRGNSHAMHHVRRSSCTLTSDLREAISEIALKG